MSEKPIAAGKSSYDLIDTRRFWEALDLEEGTVLLDLGCGIGNYAVPAAGHVGPTGLVHAIDAWEEGIEQLKERTVQGKITNIRPAVADIGREIPVNPASVDVCLLATVVHDLIQVNRLKGTMTGINRVLTGHGRLAVVEFKKMDGPPGPPIRIRLSPEELSQVVQPFGFTRPKITDVGAYHYLAQFERIS